MNNITQFPGGTLSPTRRGMELAIAMCAELEDAFEEEAVVTLNEECQLEAEYRDGRPFRNIVLERLQVARELGVDVEYGFCAFLSHIVSLSVAGASMNGSDMDRVLEIAAL